MAIPRCSFMLLMFLFISPSFASLSDHMYQELESSYFCFRRLNKTHEIGCASKFNGNYGVVHRIRDGEAGDIDVDYILKDGPDNEYVAIMPEAGVSRIILEKFVTSGRVAGVVITQGQSSSLPTGWSADGRCPNSPSSFYNDVKQPEQCHKWNPENRMSSVHHRSWPFPIFYVKNETSINRIIKCFDTFNHPTLQESSSITRKCAIKLFARMSAAKDSDTCIRRSGIASYLTEPEKYCDPLTGQSVVTLLKPQNKSKKADDNSIVLVTARLDSFSIFDGLSPGADSAASGVVTLLAVASALQKSLGTQDVKKNVMFALLNGEAFDYIGSSSMIFDMQRERFVYNVSLTSFSHIIELNQLFPTSKSDGKYFIHVDPNQFKDSKLNLEIEKMVNKTQALFKENNIAVSVNSSLQLPPSSIQSFLNSQANIPSILLSNFDAEFTNDAYNSLYDTYDFQAGEKDLDKVALEMATVAKIVAEMVASLVTDKAIDITMDEELMSDMITCYMKNATCPFFHSIVDVHRLSYLRDEPYPMYVSVSPMATHISYLSFRGLFKLNGRIVSNITTSKQCLELKDDNYQFIWMFGDNYIHNSTDSQGSCYQSVTRMIRSQSPYFQKDGGTDPWLSTWTESVWMSSDLTLYVQPSSRYEHTVLACGLIIMIVSFILTYFVHRNAESIFEDHTAVAC